MTARQPTTAPPPAKTGAGRPARSPIKILAAVVAASLTLGLAACGDDGDNDDESNEDASATGSEPSGDETSETTEEPEADASELTGEEAEIGDVVATAFDSSVPFEDKVDLLEGGDSHQADHEGYVTVADSVGGITVEATGVAIDGDTATVTYRVLFAGTETYSDLTMDVTRGDDAWVVPTAAFCGFLAAAHTPCSEAG